MGLLLLITPAQQPFHKLLKISSIYGAPFQKGRPSHSRTDATLKVVKGRDKENAVPVHVVKAHGAVEVQIHSFLTSVLEAGGQCHVPADLPWEKNPLEHSE
jgi:hypothetical protein